MMGNPYKNIVGFLNVILDQNKPSYVGFLLFLRDLSTKSGTLSELLTSHELDLFLAHPPRSGPV